MKGARLSILAAPGVGSIHASLGTADTCHMLMIDRRADGHAFRGERVVRLPRRLSRRLHAGYLVGYPALVRRVLEGRL